MSDVIQCPTCSKKFKLPAKPPATFTCTGCQTVMDLSGFAAAAVPAIPVAPAAPAAPATRAGPSRRAAGAAAASAPARRSTRAAPSRSRGRRAVEEEDEGGEETGRRGHAKKKDNTTLLIVGSGIAMVVLGVLAVVVISKNKDEPEEPKPKTAAVAPGAPAATGETPAPAAPVAAAPAAPVAPAAPPAEPGKVALKGGGAAQKAEVKTYPFTADTTADEQNKINEAVNAAVEIGGRDGRDAEKYLHEMDLKSMPRLISEFKNIQDKHGLDKPEGLKRALVVDRVLRLIDGVQERTFNDRMPINYSSEPSQALATIKRWNWWWDTGQYKTRTKPWDPREDETDAGEDAGGD